MSDISDSNNTNFSGYLRIGTSGYSYPEWTDSGFYPPNTKASQMLNLYEQKFRITELNYTWYQMPKAYSIERMQKSVSSDFYFTAKLIRKLTHEIDADQWRKDAVLFRDGIAPLLQSNQLSAVLMQFPQSFERNKENRFYLATLLDELSCLPLAIEFRNVSWANDKVFKELERRKVTLVIVDEPNLPGLFPRLDVITNTDLFYIRFHGRNTKGWRSGNMQLQFDYCYTSDELDEFTDLIEKLTKKVKNGDNNGR